MNRSMRRAFEAAKRRGQEHVRVHCPVTYGSHGTVAAGTIYIGDRDDPIVGCSMLTDPRHRTQFNEPRDVTAAFTSESDS